MVHLAFLSTWCRQSTQSRIKLQSLPGSTPGLEKATPYPPSQLLGKNSHNTADIVKVRSGDLAGCFGKENHPLFFLPNKYVLRTHHLGVPVVVQWKRIRLGTMRWRVRSLASLSGLRIQRCCELWCRPAAVALIGPLAWEPPYPEGAALKPRKKFFKN